MSHGKLIILVGISCSGKTTWASEYLKANSGSYRVSRDDERVSLFGLYRQGSQKEEWVITNIVREKVISLLSRGFTVLLDNTHLRWEYLEEALNDYGYLADIKFEIIPPEPLETLIARNKERFARTGILIPEFVLKKQREEFDSLMTEHGHKLVTIPKTHQRTPLLHFNNRPHAFIVDLDGTMALLNRSPFNPTEEEVLADEENLPVTSVVCELMDSYTIIFLSGRTDNYRTVTEVWLRTVLGLRNSTDPLLLYMRKEGDQRPDHVIKKELYNEYVRDQYDVMGAIDDRSSIVQLWQRLGIFTFDVSQGKGRF